MTKLEVLVHTCNSSTLPQWLCSSIHETLGSISSNKKLTSKLLKIHYFLLFYEKWSNAVHTDLKLLILLLPLPLGCWDLCAYAPIPGCILILRFFLLLIWTTYLRFLLLWYRAWPKTTLIKKTYPRPQSTEGVPGQELKACTMNTKSNVTCNCKL